MQLQPQLLLASALNDKQRVQFVTTHIRVRRIWQIDRSDNDSKGKSPSNRRGQSPQHDTIFFRRALLNPFSSRMPIQHQIEITCLDRPTRLADGLELECAPVSTCLRHPEKQKPEPGCLRLRGRNLRPKSLLAIGTLQREAASNSSRLVWVPRSRVLRGIRLHRATS